MPFIPFPNVPNVPGVPNIVRGVGNQGVVADLDVTGIGSAILSGNPLAAIDLLLKPNWGIYAQDGGGRAITPDSVIAFEYRGESKIMNYPVENGAFSSYNKVRMPFDINMRVVVTGSMINFSTTRDSFLKQLETMKNDTTLYSVVTPDAVYDSVNVVHYDYARSSNQGMFMIIADIGMQEVVVVGDPIYSSTKSDSSAATQSGGKVSTTPPTQSQAMSAGDLF